VSKRGHVQSDFVNASDQYAFVKGYSTCRTGEGPSVLQGTSDRPTPATIGRPEAVPRQPGVAWHISTGGEGISLGDQLLIRVWGNPSDCSCTHHQCLGFLRTQVRKDEGRGLTTSHPSLFKKALGK
jgi:hypothetical protein